MTGLVLLAACLKEDRQVDPVIRILSPSADQAFSLPDTVRVSLSVVHESGISHLRTDLTDESMNPLGLFCAVQPGQSSYEGYCTLPVNDASLESGYYYVAVTALGGGSSTKAYRRIWLNGIPQTFRKLVVLTAETSGNVGVQAWSPDSSQVTLGQITGDPVCSEVDSRHSILYLAGKNSMNLAAFSLPDLTMLWTLPNMINPPNHEPGCLWFDEYLFVTFRNEYIRGYDHLGQIRFNVPAGSQERYSLICRTDMEIVTVRHEPASGTRYLETYYLVSSMLKQERWIGFVPEVMIPLPGGGVLIASDKLSGTGSELWYYNPQSDELVLCLALQESVNDMVCLEQERVLIATDQHMAEYQTITTNYNVVSETGAQIIRFEHLNRFVAAIDNGSLYILNWPGYSPVKQFITDGPVLDVLLLYNK
ncbi:MAG: hypothetical protein JW861_01805 [Bacteroidales bacterium]|nr:hypothetical protein [Bacteroidales bacterium]